MARNPFADDADDELIKKANEDDVQKVREAKETEDEEGNIEIDVDRLKEEDEEKADGGRDEDGKTRQERRRDRYAANKQEAAEARERADRLEREASEERTRRIALETQLQAQRQPQGPQQDADPEGQEIMRIRAERESLHQAYQAKAATITPQEYQQFKQRGQELLDMESQTMFQRNMRLAGLNRQPQMDPQAVQREVKKQHLMTTYPDVFANQNRNVTNHVVNVFGQLLSEGKPDNDATIAEAVSRTRRAFNLGPKPSPTSAATRARLSSGGTGSASGRAESDSGPVKMGPVEKKMAEKAFPHMSQVNAHKQWAKTIGVKLQQKSKGA